MNYGLEKVNITKLNEIDEQNTTKYYRYKGIDFYFKKYDNSDRILVCLHGAATQNGVKKTQLPIFRGYNWSYNILCISDKLIELYPDIYLGWYLSTKSLGIMNHYLEIIESRMMYKNMIFIGSSGGGFPALLYSSYFHKKAIIQNAQIFLNNYEISFKKLLSKLNIKENQLVVSNGEQIINKYGLPKKAIIYCNKRNTQVYDKHFLPFSKFIKTSGFDRSFEFIEFIGNDPIPPKTHHTVNMPPEIKDLSEIIDPLFSLD